MINKILFVSHTTNFVKFNIPYMRWFLERGWEVDYASAEEETFPDEFCTRHFKICFNRSPYSYMNVKAYFYLKKIIDNGHYSIIHCHTPMGGVVARLAARDARRNGTSVIYTAHGFHFYKGASVYNWMFYYVIEKYLSNFTDCLITLNKEDYEVTQTKAFGARSVYRIDGVGVNIDNFTKIDILEKSQLRKKYGFGESQFILIYIAEFIKRKNHLFIINAANKLKDLIPNLKVILVGNGELYEKTLKYTEELGLNPIIEFTGYTRDVKQFCQLADVMVSSSRQEGLPISLIEGMACGLPIVCTKIRGHVDIIQSGINGYLYDQNDESQFMQHIVYLYKNRQLIDKISGNNVDNVKQYSLSHALENMEEIYQKCM